MSFEGICFLNEIPTAGLKPVWTGANAQKGSVIHKQQSKILPMYKTHHGIQEVTIWNQEHIVLSSKKKKVDSQINAI